MRKLPFTAFAVFLLLGCSTQERRPAPDSVYPTARDELENDPAAVSRLADRLGCLIHEQQFDKARELYDRHKHLLELHVEWEKEHPNPQVGRLCARWLEGMEQVRNILGKEDMAAEEKRLKALEALTKAHECKRQAAMLKIFE